MLGESHDLVHEFPEMQGKIAHLRGNNPDFADLMSSYDDLDAEIRTLEERGQPIGDVALEDMKKRRVVLKDQLYAILHG